MRSIPVKLKFSMALAGASAMALALATGAAADDNYPAKPIKIMVGFSAGGGTDTSARGFASYVHEAPSLNGMPAVIVNKPGGSGMIAAKVVAEGEKDGYTLYMINNGTFTVNHMKSGAKAPVDPLKDMQVLGCVTQLVTSLQVPADSPYGSAAEMVEDFKKSGKTLRWSTSGAGTMHAMVGHAFLNEVGIKHQVVPFKGGSKARNALAAKKVDASFNGVHLVAGFESKVKSLGVPLSERDEANKKVPTLAEQGLPGVNVSGPMCLWGPKGMPEGVVAKLQDAVKHIAGIKGFKRFIKKNKLAPMYMTAEQGTSNAEGLYKTLEPVVAKVFKK
ncbi:MAG: tripartite tricarboxylate transporter substrate binding protein [Pseudomonadota bacterium]